MRYVLFLRGINVGGKNKVSMSELKLQIQNLGLKNPISYINSGNLIFSSNLPRNLIVSMLEESFKKNYPFNILFTLLSEQEYLEENMGLPEWWGNTVSRRDILFLTNEVEIDIIHDFVEKLKLTKALYYSSNNAVYLASISTNEFLKTEYYKIMGKHKINNLVTIRNDKTFYKMLIMLENN